jgi:hypothetical protein
MSIFSKIGEALEDIKPGELLEKAADVATQMGPTGQVIGGVLQGVSEVVDGEDEGPGDKPDREGREGKRRENRRRRRAK